MIKIVEHKSKSGKLEVCTRIYGSTPMGDYLRLKEEYKLLDPSYDWGYMQSYFLEYKRKIFKTNKIVHCVYCGNKILRRGNKKQLATVDHFFPKMLNGINPSDKRNFVISCYTCNSEKGSLIYPIESLKFLHLNKNHLDVLTSLKIIEKELG